MELADVMLALGGDKTNTVPKFGVTPAEIAVLAAIHGNDAVHDISPTGKTISISFREERERLMALYPAKNEDNEVIVLKVYPGVSPILHETIESLGLDESLFKATEHAKPAPAKAGKPKPVKAAPPPLAEIVNDPTDASGLFEDDDAVPAVME